MLTHRSKILPCSSFLIFTLILVCSTVECRFAVAQNINSQSSDFLFTNRAVNKNVRQDSAEKELWTFTGATILSLVTGAPTSVTSEWIQMAPRGKFRAVRSSAPDGSKVLFFDDARTAEEGVFRLSIGSADLRPSLSYVFCRGFFKETSARSGKLAARWILYIDGNGLGLQYWVKKTPALKFSPNNWLKGRMSLVLVRRDLISTMKQNGTCFRDTSTGRNLARKGM